MMVNKEDIEGVVMKVEIKKVVKMKGVKRKYF